MSVAQPIESMGRARVLVVDDDAAYRRIVSQTIESIPQLELAGVAPTLSIARRRIEQGGIDAVTLDVMMRDECGLELLSWIRREHPRMPVVLLTAGRSSTACRAVDALLLGAVAIVIKPMGTDAPAALRRSLAQELVGVGQRPENQPKPTLRGAMTDATFASAREVIAVGASTGGPPVVMHFLKSLPAGFDVPIVLTQHMPKTHLPFFVSLLSDQSGRRVFAAQDGTLLEHGCTYIATGDGHLTLRRAGDALEIITDHGPEEHHCRPAVDPMFRSVAQVCGASAVGVLMTGMGSDGALGSQALRAVGAPVVIQDKATSVVWGMPGAAAALGAADKILPSDQLASCVVGWTTGVKVGRAQRL